MIKEAWNFIIHTPLKIALVICIVLPAVFAGVFLGSLFDPFGMSSNLKAAVVNNDQAVEFNDNDIDIGKTMVKKLEEVDDMTFVETSDAEAQEGLRSGKYAMIITIPEDFSACAASLLDESPEKMKLDVKTNPAANYLVYNIADNASKQVKAKVTKEVNKKYAKALLDAMGEMQDGLKTAQKKSDKLVDGVDKLRDGHKNLQDGQSKLADGTDSMNTGIANLSGGVTKLANGASSLSEGAGKLEKGANNLDKGVASLKSGVGALKNNLPSSESVGTLQEGLGGLQAVLSHVSENGEVVLTQAQAAQFTKLVGGASNALGGYEAVRQASTKLSDGVDKLQSGSNTLVQNAGKLTSGAASLEKGVSTLNSNVGKLKDGASNLSSGVENLDEGIASLGKGVDKMSTGVDKMQSKLADGVDTAEENLAYVSKATYNQAAAPVKIEESKETDVDNLGNSLAAFFLTIGAWIGAMAFCMMYPITGRTPERGVRSWLANAAVYVPVAIVWGLALLPLMNLFLNVNPVDYAATLAVTSLSAVAFVSIIYFVNIAAGKPAMAVVLVLLSLQLASAGGIFPTSMQSGFYQVVSPWMPFTYSVEALRCTIASGGDIVAPCLVLAGVAVVFNVLSIIVHAAKGKKAAKQVDVSQRLAEMGIG